MNMAGMARRTGASLGAAAFALMMAAVTPAQAAGPTATDSWTDPVSGLTITFTTPITYPSCTPTGLTDTISTTGVPSNYQLLGQVNVGYINNFGAFIFTTVPVNVFGNLTLTINYPPQSAITLNPNGDYEYHVEPQIEVRLNGTNVPWVGNDPAAPGTLGPGQDWDVFCSDPGEPPPPPPGASGGCTPGYWSKEQHFPSYAGTGVSPTTTFQSKFTIPASFQIPNITWVQALEYNGNSVGIEALLRHAAAAYLNAGKLTFGMTQAQVVALFNQAVATGTKTAMNAAKDTLAALNERGCPLN
jgi:hypothetical protein